MTARRWSDQDTYRDAIETYADDNGIAREVAYGLIAQESGFDATAVRHEPGYYCARTNTQGDASYGLTQVLYCTALGLGYVGTPAGLFDPSNNIQLGLRLLGSLLVSHGGDAAAALSAYNGGDRPALGFGTRLADGTFRNQAYVDKVLSYASYFVGYLAERDAAALDGGDAGAQSIDDATGTAGAATADTLAVVLAGGSILYALARALHR